MATVRKDTNGSWFLLRTIGPVCACTGICAAELAVLQNALGDNVAVEHTDHIPTGARRYAYRVPSRKDT